METHFHNILNMMELYDKHGETFSPFRVTWSPFLGSRQKQLAFFGSHVTPWIELHHAEKEKEFLRGFMNPKNLGGGFKYFLSLPRPNFQTFWEPLGKPILKETRKV